jgi:RimJ/RimL family protein N-acetyltransferase
MPDEHRGPAYRIETGRLVVRCWEPADAPLLKRAVDDSLDHLRPWLPWAWDDPQPLPAKVEPLRTFRGMFDRGEDFIYGIFDSDEQRVLGGSGLHTRLGEGAREIGYWMAADAAGRGLCTEATAAIVRAGFEIERLNRIEIHCDPQNHASAAIPCKLGFTHEATLRERVRNSQGELRDVMIWSLFADDYPSTPSASAHVRIYGADGDRMA